MVVNDAVADTRPPGMSSPESHRARGKARSRKSSRRRQSASPSRRRSDRGPTAYTLLMKLLFVVALFEPLARSDAAFDVLASLTKTGRTGLGDSEIDVLENAFNTACHHLTHLFLAPVARPSLKAPAADVLDLRMLESAVGMLSRVGSATTAREQREQTRALQAFYAALEAAQQGDGAPARRRQTL